MTTKDQPSYGTHGHAHVTSSMRACPGVTPTTWLATANRTRGLAASDFLGSDRLEELPT